MKDSNRLFYIINEEGIKQEAEVLAKFKLNNGLNYITYTYGEINDNDMIKIYSTGIVGSKGNYSYQAIETTSEWDEIKDILKYLAKEDVTGLLDVNKNNLRIVGEEISVRKPKKLLVSTKFAKTVGDKYIEEDIEEKPLEIPKVEENIEVTKFTLPTFDLKKDEFIEEKKEEETAKINVPTFEELQARSKKVTEVIESSKPEVPEMPEIKPEIKEPEIKVRKENYADKFKSEVEPVLLDVFSRQQAQIDALEEELSKTKYNLFEEQKVSLSLKTANKELTEKSNRLEDELNESKSKVDGIMNLLQGKKD